MGGGVERIKELEGKRRWRWREEFGRSWSKLDEMEERWEVKNWRKELDVSGKELKDEELEGERGIGGKKDQLEEGGGVGGELKRNWRWKLEEEGGGGWRWRRNWRVEEAEEELKEEMRRQERKGGGGGRLDEGWKGWRRNWRRNLKLEGGGREDWRRKMRIGGWRRGEERGGWEEEGQ
ncbi:hypothetical protein HPP92_002331 [Vanilla planifolia]|uniref:Uncharacterized protein n=1 Tax=Vanilla planifolia TaxID=51239 RepID=A0A835S678_VANPL|nr:hypothetical protein HPP92_002331 [Vanilla planifolia]